MFLDFTKKRRSRFLASSSIILTIIIVLARGTVYAEEAPPDQASPSGDGEQSSETTAGDSDSGVEVEGSPSSQGETPAHVVEARERVERGERLFSQGNFDSALVEFMQAYDVIGDHPNRYFILYNIGQCHERSFRYDQALRYYRQYLDEGGDDAEGRAEVLESIGGLEGLLASVRLTVNLEVADVWVDGRPVGTAPGTIRIPGGVHNIEIRAEGHLPVQREVTIPAGGEEEIAVVLEELPERFQGLHQAYFWSSLGLAVASLGIAVGLGVSAFRSHNEVSSQLDDPHDRWSVTQDDIEGIGDRALAADIMFGMGALFTISTLVLGFLTRWNDEEEEEPSLSLDLGPGYASLDWRF